MYYHHSFKTKLGYVLIIADNNKLFFLKILSENNPQPILDKFCNKYNVSSYQLCQKNNDILDLTKSQLKLYFNHKLTNFNIPLNLPNEYFTSFQNTVLQQLYQIPFNTTMSYLEVAKAINKPKAFRAVANACGNNDITIIIPCHRVTASNNKLGGFSLGIDIKKWLLNHEQSYL